MHLLASNLQGTAVIEESTQHIVATADRLLVDPDRGRIVALFLRSIDGQTLLLQTVDILSWGHRIHVASADRIGAPEEFLRLQDMLRDRRSLLGQEIRTTTGEVIGRCTDVQFSSKTFELEYLFPKRFFLFRRPPIPMSEVQEVRDDIIIIRPPVRRVPERLLKIPSSVGEDPLSVLPSPVT